MQNNTLILLDLRDQYREAQKKYHLAQTEEARQFWAARMAVTISELQHPALVAMAEVLASGVAG